MDSEAREQEELEDFTGEPTRPVKFAIGIPVPFVFSPVHRCQSARTSSSSHRIRGVTLI